MSSLSELSVEITQRCPNRCLHCSSLSSPRACSTIPAASVINVAEQSQQLGLKCISISGGEPLLHPELACIVSGIDSLGMSIGFYTTGIEYDGTGRAVPRQDWSLFPRDSTRLIFSLHSWNAETHDLISDREGAFLLTKAAIHAALKQNFRVETHIVPNKLNLRELEETLNIVTSWGVERVSFLRLVPQGRARDNAKKLVLDEQGIKFLSTVGKKFEHAPENKKKVRFGIPFSGFLSHQKCCNAAESKLIIRYDGEILPCEAFKDKRFENFVLGDITTTSIRQALQNGAGLSSLSTAKKVVLKQIHESCPAQFLINQQGS